MGQGWHTSAALLAALEDYVFVVTWCTPSNT